MDSSNQKDFELLLVLIILPEQWILAASAWQCHSVRAECLITKTRWRFNLEKQTERPNWDLYKSKSSCYICCLFYLCCMPRFWFALEPEVMYFMWMSWQLTYNLFFVLQNNCVIFWLAVVMKQFLLWHEYAIDIPSSNVQNCPDLKPVKDLLFDYQWN